MQRDEAIFFLKEVFEELKKDYPNLTYGAYNTGDVGFFTKDENGGEYLVAYAPAIMQRLPKENRVKYYINCLQVLKKGCTSNTDSYKMENVIGMVSLDEKEVLSRFKQSIKSDMVKLINKRMNSDGKE